LKILLTFLRKKKHDEFTREDVCGIGELGDFRKVKKLLFWRAKIAARPSSTIGWPSGKLRSELTHMLGSSKLDFRN